jgi:hypothetical protein
MPNLKKFRTKRGYEERGRIRNKRKEADENELN